MSARWAAAYAERLGWRMMPCWPGTKRGILNHQDASSDMQAVEAALERWLDDHPGKTLPPIDRFNWAVATGPGSGIVVLDVENADGERKLVELEREHGPLPDLFPMVWSGGGTGWHGYFRGPANVQTPDLRNRNLGGLEIRGDKLLCVLPPSVHPDTGKQYRWADDRAPSIGFPDLPQGWIELLKPEPVPARPVVNRNAGRGNRYALKALENELAIAAQAPSGARNDTLNRSAHNLFRFVIDGELPADVIRDGLMAAAQHAGLRAIEAQSTIRSAARARGVAL
jgi:hypothetical protein